MSIRLATSGGEAECDLDTSDCSTLVPREANALLSEVWEPERNGGHASAPTTRSVFRCRQPIPASSVGALHSNLLITSMPVAQELTGARRSLHALERPSSKEGGPQRSSSMIEDLNQEDRVQNADLIHCTFSSGSAFTGETPTITHHNANHCSRPFASKTTERTIGVKEKVPTIKSLSNNNDQSYEKGVEVVSEKRRKRLLSNRASAQRSRQRRQDRLESLEILVAELRVENAALTRRATLAALAAKKSEKENKTLRDRLGKQELLPWSDTSIESDKASEISDLAASNNKTGNACGSSNEPTRNHASSLAVSGETFCNDSHSRESSPASRINRDGDKASKGNSKTWNNILSSSFEFGFNSDPIESDIEAFDCGEGVLNRRVEGPEVARVKDLYQSSLMNLARSSSFQNLDSFNIALEERNQEMDKRNFDSRSDEDIWRDSLATCLK